MIMEGKLIKSSLLVLLMLSILILIIGCSSKNETAFSQIKGPKIEISRLSEEEKTLIEATGAERFLAFDIDYGKERYEGLEVWVDIYENSKFIEKKHFISISNEDKLDVHRIIFTSHSFKESSIFDKWVLAYMTPSGHAHSHISMERPASIKVSYSGSIQVRRIQENIPIPLGIITLNIRDTDDNVISSLILEEEGALQEHISNNNFVYILRCSFNR